MSLIRNKKTAQTHTPRPAPTLEERLEGALDTKLAGESLLNSAIRVLHDVADELVQTSSDAADEAARLADLSNQANQHANEARSRANTVAGLL